jgi:cob(I)alamin adenosyltransferase
MRIYTRTGDKGDTTLFGGSRVPKDALRIDAYGTVDELNSTIGVVLAGKPDSTVVRILTQVQQRLFKIGADLATPRSERGVTISRVSSQDTTALEHHIDLLGKHLKPLRGFILPGGTIHAARLHVARTVCRRAERIAVKLSRNEDIGDAIVVYLNRLSDLLFVLACYANARGGVSEIPVKNQKMK